LPAHPLATTRVPSEVIIATAIDKSYLLPLQVMLASLKDHVCPDSPIKLYLFHRSLDDAQVATIASLVDTQPIVPEADSVHRLPRQRGFVPEASFPLLLPDLLPQSVDRVLFLDPDVLFLDDISKLWEIDLENRCLAAVADQAIPRCSSPRGVKGRARLGIPDGAPYFNAGVMLIDVLQWRNNEIPEQASDYIRQTDRLDFSHQEALNAVLWKDWLPLDPKWNRIASLTARRYSADGPADTLDTAIVHFAGRFKPWKMKVAGSYSAKYEDYLSRFAEAAAKREQSLATKALGFYDRTLRDFLYPLERALWNSRLI
jgi:lipopolysaccharide biosynthesis glycosyltransferase